MIGNLQGILGLIITSSVLIAIPGPGILFLVGQALSAGKKNALKGVAGNAIGMYSIAVLLSFGIGAVLMSSPQILMIIRLIGAFVLLLIGWQYVSPDLPAKFRRRCLRPPCCC
ncbi:LysE family translocator [Morganella morganii]|uniref:LysE family translocator n=1 Tax=Morganella morganii TaxID=582 RepID=UPI001FFD9475|nr:LysE family transporter [Morganella morganii]